MHRSYLYPHNPTFGALSQERARAFLRKSRSCAPFPVQTCWAHELRSNTPCPGSTFSCTDCLVHTNRAGGSPLTDGGFSLNLSWSAPTAAAGTYSPAAGICADAARAHKRVDTCGFHPLVNHPFLGGSDADYRHVTAAKRGTAEDFSTVGEHSVLPYPDIFAVPDTVLLHIRFTLRRARHKGELPKGQERVPWGIAVPRKS